MQRCWHHKSSSMMHMVRYYSQYKGTISLELTETKHAPVLIIGGGISGLTLARSFEIAKIPYMVFEKADSFHTDHKAGTGIGLWGPAERIINVLGAGEQIRNVSQRMSCAGYRTRQGAWLAQPPVISAKSITSCLTLLRGDLIKSLLDSLPKTLLYNNHEFSHYEIEKNKESITAFFKNGKSYKGSLLVGADGINSAVRNAMYPDVKPIYCGYSYYRAVTKLPPSTKSAYAYGAGHDWPLSNPEIAWETWGKSCRVAYVPLKSPKIFWFVSKTMTEEQSNQEFQRISKIHLQASEVQQNLGREISDKLSKWHSPISSVINSTPSSSILFTPIKKIKLSPSQWVDKSKRIVLIGDSCHAIPPNLASGGMISMEDAVQLASNLRPVFANSLSTYENLEEALDKYIKQRKTKVRIIQISNTLVAAVGQLSSEFSVKVRDKTIMIIPKFIRNGIFNALHRFYLGWNYTVPNLGQGLYSRLFPADIWQRDMPELLKRFHEQDSSSKIVHNCGGDVTCSGGKSFLAKIIAAAASMPPSLTNSKVTVQIQQLADGSEIWTRYFTDPHNPLKSYKFETKQYIENEDFVEVVNLFQLGLIHLEVLMNLAKMPNDIIGFKHVFKSVRVRLLPFLKGGLKINLPRFLQPIVHGTTKVHESGKSWNFDVGITAPKNWFWKMMLFGDKDFHIAGYKGHITEFYKPSITELFKANAQQNQTYKTRLYQSYVTQDNFKVLILGGYGLFGNRIASGLIIQSIYKDFPTPTIYLNARNFYPNIHQEILDRVYKKLFNVNNFIERCDIPALVNSSIFDASDSDTLKTNVENNKIDLVINCVGPFQKTDYKIPILCAELGINYIDLADARSYVASFSSSLNEIAKANGVHLVTGVSTVPGISSAVCDYLISRANLTSVERIEIGMSPGNKTPRGLATMESILGQAGKPFNRLLQDGSSQRVFGWQKLKRSSQEDFHPKMENRKRWLSAINVPDVELLPKHIAKITNSSMLPILEFRAGLENPAMHLGLWSLSWLVRAGLIGDLSRTAKTLKLVSETAPFYQWSGSNTGGMFVKLEGHSGSKQKNITWRLYAGNGEGVQIPATPAVLLTERMVQNKMKSGQMIVEPGAYNCLSMFSRQEFMDHVGFYEIEDDVHEELN